jgi:copper resistance protein C
MTLDRRAAVTHLPPAGRLLAALVSAAVILVLAAAPAAAHNSLLTSTPAAGATVARMPDVVVLTFDEPAIAMGTQIVVTGPSGPVQSGPPVLVDTSVQQAIQPGAPAGRYMVAWRIGSVDGHPVTGTFQFTAQAAGEAQALPPGSTSPTPADRSPGAFSGGWLLLVAGLAAAAVLGALLWRKVREAPSKPRR